MCCSRCPASHATSKRGTGPTASVASCNGTGYDEKEQPLMHPARASISPALEAGLRWLDCVLERELLRTRARYMLSLNELCGLHASDAQVDALLRDRAVGSEDSDSAEALSERA